jgi:adenylate cyclase
LRFLVLLVVVITGLPGTSFSQDGQLDSLKKIVTTLSNDSTKVNTLIDIGTIYLSSDINESLKYGDQARFIAEKIDYKKGLGYAHNLIGRSYASQANYPESNVQFKAALDIFESIDLKEGVANTLSNLGANYADIGDATKSIEYHLKSLRIAEQINNKFRIGSSLLNIGVVYGSKDPDKGLPYFIRALKIFKEIDYFMGTAYTTANIGELYFNKGLYDSSLVYFNSFAQMMEGQPEISVVLSFIAEIYAEKGDFEQAFQNHNQAVTIAETAGVKSYLAKSLLSKAKTQKKQGNLKGSIENYRSALRISEETGEKLDIKIAYKALAEAYAALGDFKNAYTYESLLTQIKDTLYNTDEDKKIQQMQFTFDMEKKEAEIAIKEATIAVNEATIGRQRILNWATGITGFLLLFVVGGIYNRYKYVRKTNKIIQIERDRSKELLLNILPEETARELETSGHAKTRYYENVTVLFTDFKGFSAIAGKLRPQELVSELNDYFMAFDEIVDKFGLEKIKTIGDAYMCAGGIPVENDTHALNAVEAAIAMQEFMKKKFKELQSFGQQGWELRVGIHTGPIVAGVVGKRKYAYDIWGDTVNVASRMESNSEPGKVNISSATYDLIKDKYECHYRGKISAKNIGEVDMYFVEKEITTVPVMATG